MQNNVKLLAIRYLPGSVLLGGGWEEGPRRCQDLQLKGGKEGRGSAAALVSQWPPSRGRDRLRWRWQLECGMDFVTGLGLPPPAITVQVRAAWFRLAGTTQHHWELR